MAPTLDDEFVCAACIADPGIAGFIASTAKDDTCTFCGASSKEPIAAPLSSVIEYMERCIGGHYEDPANSLGHDSGEGGYQGETYSTDELLSGELGLDFPNDANNRLFDAIADGFENTLWCQTDPYGMNPIEQLSYSWNEFCKTIRHERRYFFLAKRRSDRELLDPAEVLDSIFSFAESADLFVTLPNNTTLYRARHQPNGEHYDTASALGPPPLERAIQTNRMSPPGIVMTYASEDRDTALAETASEPGDFAVGRFETMREAIILDLTRVPAVPTIFEEIPDSLEYDPRPRLAFLREVARDISRPIARDDRIHVEYVPTQVVTEYLRTVTAIDGRTIEGIRYKSSRRDAKNSLVLFADQRNLVLPESERPSLYNLSTDRWLKMKDSTVAKITDVDIRRWSGDS
jgi:hypothetical protein